jgi:hypothetical protein
MKWNRKKKWKPKKGWITIEEVEAKAGVKLTYPNQRIEGSVDEERYAELKRFGCSDIWDDEGTWLHRDCFSRNCEKCNYYPIMRKYYDENEIDPNIPADLGKAGAVFDFFNINDENKKCNNSGE